MKFFLNIAVVTLSLFLFVGPAFAVELTGDIALEARGFLNPPAYAEQEEHAGSVALSPELYHEFDSTLTFTAAPFFRYDLTDNERTHFDLREFFLLKVFEKFEVGFGIRKVFWGVTESAHVVDIINQTDLVESPDGEEKLGQPMLNVSIPTEFGTLDLFVLPGFRERTFPGREGRLRSEPRVDTDHPVYENSEEEFHTDFAVRYSHSIGDLELAISHFWGTSREPRLVLGTDSNSNPVFIPIYEIINQTGIEAQMIVGNFLFKFEAIDRSGQGPSFFQSAVGFEYTFTGIFNTQMDMGMLAEYLYDDRMSGASTPLQSDVMVGLRLAVNDQQSTELLLGAVEDLDGEGRSFFIESSRRFGERVKASLEVGLYDIDMGERFSFARDDDYVEVELAWYF